MESQRLLPGPVYILTDVPMGPYYHYCSQLANGLHKYLHNPVELISVFSDTQRKFPGEDESAFLDEEVPNKVFDPGKRSKLYRFTVLLYKLMLFGWQLVRSNNPVVHIHAPSGINILDVGLLIFLRLTQASVVRTIHELTSAERFGMPSALQQWLAGLQLRLVHHIIVHDKNTKARLKDEFHITESRMTVVPHGNYLVFRSFAPQEKLVAVRARDDVPVVLFQGIKRHKGIEVFLDAVRLLNQRGSRFKVLITGQVNPGDEDLLEIIKNTPCIELDSRYVPSIDMWRIYTGASMVIMPYLKGTTSGAIHLAFAFSRPIISSDLACFNNLVIDGKTGLITPAGSAEALADAIQYLLDNPAKAISYGQRGFELTSSAEYDWNRIARVTADAYIKCRG